MIVRSPRSPELHRPPQTEITRMELATSDVGQLAAAPPRRSKRRERLAPRTDVAGRRAPGAHARRIGIVAGSIPLIFRCRALAMTPYLKRAELAGARGHIIVRSPRIGFHSNEVATSASSISVAVRGQRAAARLPHELPHRTAASGPAWSRGVVERVVKGIFATMDRHFHCKRADGSNRQELDVIHQTLGVFALA